MTLEKYDELDQLNQLELAKIGKVDPVSFPLPSLGLESGVIGYQGKRPARTINRR